MSFEIVYGDGREIIKSIGAAFDELKGKTILITGANGVVGSYFVDTIVLLNKEQLKKTPVTCICFTRHNITKKSRLGHLLDTKHIYFVTGDVTKKIPIKKKIDYIIHSASYASPKLYMAKPIETMGANSVGTKNLLDIALKNNAKMMFISSGSIYGDARKGEGPFTEEHPGYVSPLETRAVYSESKRFGETYCSIYAKFFNTQITIARLSNMYGPGFRLDDGRAIPDFFNQAIHNGKIEINGDPKTTRAYVYISDAIAGMWYVLLKGKKGEAYNIASEDEHTMVAIAEKICSFFPKCNVLIKENKQKKYLTGSPVHVVISGKKLRSTLKWKQQVSLEQGLRRLYLWYTSE